jgi:hypothetical protein
MKYMLMQIKVCLFYQSIKTGKNGRLSFAQDPECKLRIIAIAIILKSIHRSSLKSSHVIERSHKILGMYEKIMSIASDL